MEILRFVYKAVAGALVLAAHGIPSVFYVVARALIPGLVGIGGCAAFGRVRVRPLLGAGSIVEFVVEFLFLLEFVPLDTRQLALLVAFLFVYLVRGTGLLAGSSTLRAVLLGVCLGGHLGAQAVQLRLFFGNIVPAVLIPDIVVNVIFQTGCLFLLEFVPLDALIFNHLILFRRTTLVSVPDLLTVFLGQAVKVFERFLFFLFSLALGDLLLCLCFGACMLAFQLGLDRMLFFELVCVGCADLVFHRAAAFKVCVYLSGGSVGIENLTFVVGANTHGVGDAARAYAFRSILRRELVERSDVALRFVHAGNLVGFCSALARGDLVGDMFGAVADLVFLFFRQVVAHTEPALQLGAQGQVIQVFLTRFLALLIDMGIQTDIHNRFQSGAAELGQLPHAWDKADGADPHIHDSVRALLDAFRFADLGGASGVGRHGAQQLVVFDFFRVAGFGTPLFIFSDHAACPFGGKAVRGRVVSFDRGFGSLCSAMNDL